MPIQDLDKKSEAELLELLANPDKIAELKEESAPEPKATPDEAAPQEAAAEPEAAPEETPEEQPATVEALDAELLRRRLESAEAEAKRFEQLAGRNAGELGYVKNKIRDLEAKMAQGQSGDIAETGYATESEERPRPSARDAVTAYVVSQAVPSAINAFEGRHPDSVELAGGMVDYLTQNNINIAELAQGDDPVYVASETERVLSNAYEAAKSIKRATEIQTLETKRAEMFERLKTSKTNASISASGSAPAPPPQQKTLGDLSEAQLMAELQRALRS